ncbi:MAG: hypothetical protein K0S01_3249 [Herbinix sp.]|jgi:hypothetical protein|nr:hypothetical protein [Herbinix sp.]
MEEYKPIRNKINAWILYLENSPKCKYSENPVLHDEFRKEHDLDCVLTDGDLLADTIFSLWTPLRFTLVRINGYSKLQKYGKVEKSIGFLKAIIIENVLEGLLPINKPEVLSLITLFELGQTRANVMILPIRKLNRERGKKPYYDYMPYFLYECLQGGDFSFVFENDDKQFIKWISDEKLTMLFNESICRRNIKDLAQTGNVKYGVPKNIDIWLKNYIGILIEREILLKKDE